MELREYLKTTVNKKTKRPISMWSFGNRIGRAQSIVSRIAAKKHRADPVTAVRIVVATAGAVTLDDLYGTPARWRADRKQ